MSALTLGPLDALLQSLGIDPLSRPGARAKAYGRDARLIEKVQFAYDRLPAHFRKRYRLEPPRA